MTENQSVGCVRTDTEDTNGGGGGGGILVKKLFFPAYADAGAADSFLVSSSSEQPQQVADSDATAGSLARLSPSIMSDGDGNGGGGGGGGCAGSEASTAVRDNRSFRLAHPSSMQRQRPSTTVTATPSTPAKKHSTNGETNCNSNSNSNSLTSPPKVPRIPLPIPMPQNNQRSLSQKVEIDYDKRVEYSRVDSIKDGDDDDDDESTVYQEASGMAIFAATLSSSTSSSPPTLPATPISAPIPPLASNGHLQSPFFDPNQEDDDDDDDQNSSISDGIRDVQDRSILDYWSQSDSKEGNTTTTNNSSGNSHEEWEEEATPAQTAFGKQLLFQRRLPPKRNSCDSTASEQGTVVNHSQRLQELDHDMEYHEQSQSTNHNNSNNNALSPATASLYSTPPQEEENLDDENGLALPVLDSSANATGSPMRTMQHYAEIQTTTKAVVGSPVLRSPLRIHRTKFMLRDLEDDEEDPVHLDDYSAKQEEKKQTETDRTLSRQSHPHHPLKHHRGGINNSSSNNNNRSSGILSMAIRRLGSGFTSSSSGSNNNNNLSSSVSAPTSPQPYHRYTMEQQSQKQQQLLSFSSPVRSTASHMDATTTSAISSPVQQQGRKKAQSQSYLPPSFLLRSPGSSAFQQAKTSTSASSKTRPWLVPKMASNPWNGESGSSSSSHRFFDKISEHDTVGSPIRSTSHSRNGNSNNNNIKALQIARSCFSYDAMDTSMDEQYEFSVPNRHHPQYLDAAGGINNCFPKPQQQYVRRENRATTLPAAEDSSSDWPMSCASWDAAAGASVRGVAAHGTSNQNYVALFRPRPTAGRTRQPHPPEARSLNSSPRRISRPSGDHSPSSAVMSLSETLNLQTPQRIEMEREDALDILACLVERGVTWKQDPCVDEVDVGESRIGQQEESSKSAGKGKPQETFNTDVGDGESTRSLTPSLSEITAIVRELEELSLAEEKLGDFSGHSETYKKRKRALDELLRSHEYALEMQRASQSASTWLMSIGRSHSNSPAKQADYTHLESVRSSLNGPKSKQVTGEDLSASESMDILTVKALLHSSQMEVREMALATERLNEELAKCRAEIGRLKTAANSTVYRSPNRSILDESDDISVTEGDEEEEDIDVLERSFESIASVGNGDNESSFLKNHGEEASEIFTGNGKTKKPCDDTHLAMYAAALEDANAMIRQLHRCLKSPDRNHEMSEDPPVITVPRGNEATKSPERKCTPCDHELATASEKVFDDNFVADWDDLSSSIQGPPDHELRSPIVASILESWSTDHNLHESLVAWIDHILNGCDPETIPPLTLSNLDRQVRDAFMVHVLPLLLRRPDIRLDVKSRVHRRTTYDISVSVDSVANRDLSNDLHRSVTVTNAPQGSVASSGLMNNAVGIVGTFYPKQLGGVSPTRRIQTMSRLSYDEMSEDIPPPDDGHPGLMSTLGGALGGLLTRRKGLSHESLPPEGPPSNMESILESPSSAGLASEIVGLAEGDDDQPYHRVVSAPPGRIGVTFVEYRGHCMVSDVNADSPLIGWIFPSDVLIAIDELPVSGMRVRDIIKVLKDRTERQRALRVVSSHAMNEFTLNATSDINEMS